LRASAQREAMNSGPLVAPPVHEHHVRVLGENAVERVPDGAVVVAVTPLAKAVLAPFGMIGSISDRRWAARKSLPSIIAAVRFAVAHA
jgi:hypothetical protein